MKGSPEKILTFLKLSDCLFTVEHGQKINSYNFSRMKYPIVYLGFKRKGCLFAASVNFIRHQNQNKSGKDPLDDGDDDFADFILGS